MEFDFDNQATIDQPEVDYDLLKHETWEYFQDHGTNRTIPWLKKKMEWGYFEAMTFLVELINTYKL